MALSLRSSSKADSSTGTAISVAAPSGTAIGDLVKIVVHGNGQTTIVDNNGATPFTEQINDHKPNTSNGHTVSVFTRVIQSGDPSTYNFTLGASGRWAVIASCWTDSSSPQDDVAPSTANCANDDSASSGTINAPSITTLVDNAIHVVFCGWDTSATGTITTPSGYTLIENANSGGEPLHMAYKVITAAGATGAVQCQNTEFGAMIAGSFSIKGATAASLIKTVNGLAIASVKSVNGLAIASVKTINGLTNV